MLNTTWILDGSNNYKKTNYGESRSSEVIYTKKEILLTSLEDSNNDTFTTEKINTS